MGDGPPVIAALLLDEVNFDLAAVLKLLQAKSIFGQAVKSQPVTDKILSFSLGDETVFIAPMGAPYPWSDLEGPCQTSWMWPAQTPATTLKSHKSFVLVTLMGGTRDAIARRLTLTHLVGRMASLPHVVAVHWPEATMVHYPPIFIKMAQLASAKDLPLHLWVDFRGIMNPDATTSIFTTGLAPLGLMEMEILNLSIDPEEMREWAMNVTQYMIDRGASLPNGNVIGRTADEKYRITHGSSSFGAKGTVMKISK